MANNSKIKAVIIILWLLAFTVSLWSGYDYFVQNVGYMPAQPVVLSHVTHSQKFGIKCLFCHNTAETSPASSLPTTKTCMVCHLGLATKLDQLVDVEKSYFDTIPLLWNRVYRLPDYVRFDHSRHIRSQIDCSSCHGEVETMEAVRQVRELTMKWCLDCHRNPAGFIVYARDISGIFRNDSDYVDNRILIAQSNEVVSPSFGQYISYMRQPSVPGIPMPKRPARAPETCTSCHF